MKLKLRFKQPVSKKGGFLALIDFDYSLPEFVRSNPSGIYLDEEGYGQLFVPWSNITSVEEVK